MKTFKLNSQYMLKIHTLNTDTNTNQSANIYKNGENQPICGTIFCDKIKAADIKEWANKRVADITNETFFLILNNKA